MCFQCTLTRLPVWEEGVSFRAGTEIGAGDVFTAERAAVVPERTFIHICATRTHTHSDVTCLCYFSTCSHSSYCFLMIIQLSLDAQPPYLHSECPACWERSLRCTGSSPARLDWSTRPHNFHSVRHNLFERVNGVWIIKTLWFKSKIM